MDEFQSLFYWMVRSKKTSVLWERNCFQVSILVLLDGALEVGYPHRHESIQRPFQSLFYWMVRSKVMVATTFFMLCFLFQSLFYWMVRSKPQPTIPCIPRKVVSILVLLDGALEAPASLRSPTAAIRFNPCSIGWCARSRISFQSIQ